MNRQTLDILAAVLLRCFLLCALLQLFTFGMVTLAHDWAYNLHSSFFKLTPEVFDITVYSMLALMKTLGLTLFFCPWLAVLWVKGRLAD